MDTPRTVPAALASEPLSLSAQQAEDFFASGTQAYPFEKNVTVDLPGVGATPLRSLPSIVRGRDTVPGEIPPALQEHLREEILIKLLFAARNLAEQQLGPDPFHPTVPGKFRCKECHRTARAGGPIPHRDSCLVGRVFATITELWGSYVSDSNSNGKEAALEVEGHAGDGIRPRGEFGEPWNWAADQTLGLIKIHDADGCLIAQMHGSARGDIERAARLIDCVNSCCGIDLGEGGSL